MATPLVCVRGLSVRYRTRDAVSHAADGVSLDIERGRVFALVGESGAGKSTVGAAIPRLLPAGADVLAGEIAFDGVDLLAMREPQLRALRGRRVAMIFQDPVAGLNPVLPVGDQVAEVLTAHLGRGKREARAQAVDVLARAGLPDPKRVAKSLPFQLSGGMCQRVMIGIATALEPDLIIADEPTAALDVTVQAQILHQLDALRRERDAAILLITHDFGVVSQIADDVGVMYAGRLVETGPVRETLASPLHPYTHGLLAALPRLDAARRELHALPGAPPDLDAPAEHCAFAPRCRKALNQCRNEPPPPLETPAGQSGRAVACYNPVWQG